MEDFSKFEKEEFINEIKRLERVLETVETKFEYDEAKSEYDNIKLIIEIMDKEYVFAKFITLKLK